MAVSPLTVNSDPCSVNHAAGLPPLSGSFSNSDTRNRDFSTPRITQRGHSLNPSSVVSTGEALRGSLDSTLGSPSLSLIRTLRIAVFWKNVGVAMAFGQSDEADGRPGYHRSLHSHSRSNITTMFRVIKRSRSMRDAWGGRAGHAGGDDLAHGPAAPSSDEPGSVSGPALHDAGAHGIQNAALSPVRFPDGKNPYLDRPLPPPPPPKIAPPAFTAMPARPSTSGGPSAKASVVLGLSEKPGFDKRVSRDDMYLTGRMGSKRGLQPYRLGARGLPTPESSPGVSPPMPAPSAVPARMPTPESLRSGEIQIGMALGSPSHPPETYSGWQPQEPPSFQPPQAAQQARARALASLDPTPSPVSTPTAQRQKTQRRKLFGGLFGSRKNAEPAKAVEASEASSSSPATVIISSDRQHPFGESTPTRSNTVADRRTAKHKPIIIRSNTEPAVETPAAEELRTYRTLKADSPKPTLGYTLEPDNSGPVSSTPSITTTPSAGPFLDVEIPSIKMERYSVMFDSLLNPQGSSSLLARRQATLEKLKTINDRIVREEEELQRSKQRRATSPQPTKSPAFTLFPPSGGQHQGNSPRVRSNTSPALLPLPSQLNFDRNHHHSRKEKKTVTIVSPRTADQRSHAETANREQEIVRIPGPDSGFHFGPEESGVILDSPKSMDENDYPRSGAAPDEAPHAIPMTSAIHEPQWHMVSPLSSSASSSVITTATRPSPSSSASSVRTHVTRPSVDTEAGAGAGDSALKTAVEISIARQISISRQQRTLLRPMKTAIGSVPARGQQARQSPSPVSAVAAAAGGGGSGVARAASSPIRKGTLSQNERVAATRLTTPTLVVPTETVHSQLAEHRKSEMVVLEAM